MKNWHPAIPRRSTSAGHRPRPRFPSTICHHYKTKHN